MPFKLTFTMLGLPTITSNGSHGHWRKAYNERRRWKTSIKALTLSLKPPKPLNRALLTLTRRSSIEPDFDNMAISFKPIIDGLTEAGIIADDSATVIGRPTYKWEKAPPKKGSIIISIVEVET